MVSMAARALRLSQRRRRASAKTIEPMLVLPAPVGAQMS
jgi:hypothetical protein